MTKKVTIVPSPFNGGHDIIEHEIPAQVARFAMTLIERWGMVAATPNGEDSAGRARARLLSPFEVVDRAFLTAIMTFARIRDEGLMIDVPEMDDERKSILDKLAKERARRAAEAKKDSE